MTAVHDPHLVRISCRQLVKSRGRAAEDKGGQPARRVDPRHEVRIFFLGCPDCAGLHLRGVRQRTKHVESCGEAERAAHWGGEAHRRVHLVSEKECNADLIENGAQLIDLDVQVDAQRLDHVGRTGL